MKKFKNIKVNESIINKIYELMKSSSLLWRAKTIFFEYVILKEFHEINKNKNNICLIFQIRCK
jgi:hypothetical protein